MKSSLLFCLVALTPIIVAGTPQHLSESGNLAAPLTARDGPFFPIRGIAGMNNQTVHPRREVRELEQIPDQWNVYLIGLSRFQNMSQDDKLSYFQIAAIHGRPHAAWDGVEGAKGGYGGYCEHSSSLFTTWHRPYLALFEQMLYTQAGQVISEFPDGELKTRYSRALQELRIPYWDYAAVPPNNRGTLPWSLQRPTISVVLPEGNTTIPNPLFSYTFHPLPPPEIFGNSPWTIWGSTLRYPDSKVANATSRNNDVAEELTRNFASVKDTIYNNLAYQKLWFNMSTDRASGWSVEAVHGTIHNTVGNGGHMTPLDFSAFDPIFWLLHANVDRLVAIWQTLNPDSYLTSYVNPYPTFTAPAGSSADQDTSLKPFHSTSEGDFWTSRTVRDHTVFGYTYPELIDLTPGGNSSANHSDTEFSRRSSADGPSVGSQILISRVNSLYAPNATSQFSWDIRGQTENRLVRTSWSPPSATDRPYTVGAHDVMHKRSANSPISVPCHPSDENTLIGYRLYIANLAAKKYGLDGSFKVYFFLDAEENDCSNPETWIHEPGFVGLLGIFSQQGMREMMPTDQLVYNSVSLTKALEDKVKSGDLESMHEDMVREYLAEKLSWRVMKPFDEIIHCESTPGFQLEVLYAEVVPPPTNSEFPRLINGGFRQLLNFTEGKRLDACVVVITLLVVVIKKLFVYADGSPVPEQAV